MRSRIAIVVALLLCVQCAPAPAVPRRAAPEGYKQRDDPQGGTILVADHVGGGSGPDMVRDALGDLKPSFDAPPRLTAGFTDTLTGQTQAMFVSKLADKLIDGIVVGAPSGDGGTVGIVYDLADRFAESRPRLMRQLLAELPALAASPPAETAEMQDTRLPDGSGNIKLPPGWIITSANQGAVEAHGPNGEALVLGVALSIAVPSGFGNGPFVLPYMAPEQAIVAITPSLNYSAQQSGGPTHDNVRVLESQRTDYAGGQAAFLVWQSDAIAGGRRTPETAFGLVISAPVGPGAWMLYLSGALAPRDRFAQAFPLMLQSWQSWKINDRVFAERLRRTAETMRQTTEILQSANKTQQKTFDKANAAWDEYLSGLTTVIDARTGRPTTMPLSGNQPLDPNGNPKLGPNGQPAQPLDLNKWMEDQNRQAGFTRYKPVDPGGGTG